MSQGALPGFRDFYPEQLATRNYLMSVWRDVARRYGFVEYDGPPLEPLELYTRKSGDEIVGQLYTFTDKGDREVALRPEMTPTLARMVAAKANAMRDAEASGTELVGVWHSHTHTDAYPSDTDVRQAVDPAWVYIVVSLKHGDPVLRAYRIREGAVAETQVVLENR